MVHSSAGQVKLYHSYLIGPSFLLVSQDGMSLYMTSQIWQSFLPRGSSSWLISHAQGTTEVWYPLTVRDVSRKSGYPATPKSVKFKVLKCLALEVFSL